MRVGIVGAGMAGLTLGTLLGRAGHEVRIFEQADAPGPLGAGLLLQPSGQAVLGRLGLLRAVERDSWPIRTFRANSAPGRRLALLRYDRRDPNKFALGVGRGRLFQVLWDAAVEAGAAVVAGTRVVEARQSGAGSPSTTPPARRSASSIGSLQPTARGQRSAPRRIEGDPRGSRCTRPCGASASSNPTPRSSSTRRHAGRPSWQGCSRSAIEPRRSSGASAPTGMPR